MPTSTIKDVELVSVGVWAASTGVTTVTLEDLTSMLSAHADGFVDHAPVKLGHVSSLNDGINLGDGEPAYGWVVPTGIRKNAAGRDTLVGDLVGMPSQLAAIAPTAYRRRSVEIAWDVKAQGGKTYRAALTGVALLGAEAPAVKGLADVLALYSAAPESERRDYIEVVEGLEDQPAAVRVLSHLRAAGATEAELTELAAAGGMRDTVNLPPAIEVPDNDGPQTSPHTRTQEGRTMALTDDQIRKALKLEEGADVEAEVNRIIAEHETAAVVAPGATAPAAVAPVTPTTPAAPAAPSTPAVGAATAPGQPATPELVGAGAGGETVALSAGTLAELQRDAAWARDRRRAEALDGAVRAGRISPAERGYLTSELSAAGQPATALTGFAAAIERDEPGTIALLSTLSPRFATSALGADDAAPAATADAAFDAFESQVFGLDRAPQA